MPRLTNVTLTNVEHKKDGTTKDRAWKLYHVKVDNPDWAEIRFSYFLSGNKPELKEGTKLDYLEYEEKQDGQYTNYTITGVGVQGAEQPKPSETAGKPSGSGGGSPRNEKAMFYAYAKDLEVARIEHGAVDPDCILANVVYIAETLYKCSQGDPKALDRIRETIKALREGSIPKSESNTGQPREPDEQPTERDLEGPAKEPVEPDAEEPEKEQKPVEIKTKAAAKKLAAEWAFKISSIDNIPHLENWWQKCCGSQPRKALEAKDVDQWIGVCNAYKARKEQLKEEFKAEKDQEESGEPESGDLF